MRFVLTLSCVAALAAGCASGDDEPGAAGVPVVYVTNSILGDIVAATLGDQAQVELLMPFGADPHDFAPSSRQVAEMTQADLVVAGGAGFEHGMEDVLANIESDGTSVFRMAEHVELLQVGDTDDPHFWTDPAHVQDAVRALAARVSTVEGFDPAVVQTRADDYVATLTALDAEVEDILAPIPAAQRVLVTDHEVFGYFADRYGFEVIGTVIPSLSTGAAASAADVTDLAALVSERDVPAIFGSTTEAGQLAEALAAEVGRDVQVVDLHTESLDEPGSGAASYVELLRTDAQRIAEALTE